MQLTPDQENPLHRLAMTVGIYVATFLAGALIAFAYSYGPLHSGKNWKIGYLEERIESKDVRLAQIEGELARVKVDSEGKPDTETFKLLQDELATTDKTIQNLEYKLTRSERRIKELERSRSNWKKKHAASQAKLEQSIAPPSTTQVTTDALGASEASGETTSESDAVPAAPAQSPGELDSPSATP